MTELDDSDISYNAIIDILADNNLPESVLIRVGNMIQQYGRDCRKEGYDSPQFFNPDA
jgi:hypothetical protein